MKSTSAMVTARHRSTTRNAIWGASALMMVWLVLGGMSVAAVAAERQGEDTGIKVVRDVSYGPDVRNVMDFYLPEGKAT